LALFALLVPFFGEAIFIPLELFVAFVQALIFALLTLVFLEIATTSPEHAQVETEKEALQQYERAEEEKEAVAAS